jgi:hypothetical protein
MNREFKIIEPGVQLLNRDFKIFEHEEVILNREFTIIEHGVQVFGLGVQSFEHEVKFKILNLEFKNFEPGVQKIIGIGFQVQNFQLGL